MGPLLFVGVLVIGGVISTGNRVTADVIIESRAESICSYEIDRDDNRLTDDNCFLDDQEFVVAVATDAHEDLVFFSDIVTAKLLRIEAGRQVPQTLLYGLGSVEGIAVDWLAKNIFWTDFLLGHICVSRYDGSHRAILIEDDIQEARGIAVDPFDGLIFWADFRGTADGRVDRSNMDGTRRVAIITQDLSSPSGLVIDFNDKRLYFADRGTDKIESVTYDGQDRTVIYQQASADFFDITIHGDYLYATVWRTTEADGEVKVIQARGRDAGEVIQTFDHSDRALGIATMDEGHQPDELNGARGACDDDNGLCDHLCLPIGTRRLSCACATGYSLADDQTSCETADHKSEEFLLVADSSLNGIYQVDASMDDHGITALPMDGLEFPVALAYDHVDGMVYWTDRAQSAIGRAMLNGSSQESVLLDNILDPGGVALDTRRRLIYWTDEDRNQIGIAGMNDNLERRVFISQDLDEPRAIAVNLENGDVYWTDWGAVAKIERVSRDGSDRQTLVEGDLVWPNCLAVDSIGDIMYWCDAQRDRIEASDLDGNGRRTLVSFAEQSHPFALVIYGEFVYWTDWLRHRLSRADRWTGEGVEEVGPADYLRMQGLVAFEFPHVFEEETTFTPTAGLVETTPEPPPPMNGALNVTLIAAAAGGGLALVLITILIVCCIVKCARSKGGSRGPNDHVPMSIRSTSFTGAYNPSGIPEPGRPNNNPPPLPPARKQSDPIYQDIEDYQKSIKGVETGAYQAYLNPAFKGDGGSSPNQTPSTPRYVKRVAPDRASQAPRTTKAPPPAVKPKPGPPKARAPARPDETYMTPDLPQEQDYMALRVQVP